jgi:tRNA pseudouridine38-40 synthase
MGRKRNLRLVVEYDGTGYSGWQIQKDKPTVQGELAKAVEAVSGKKALVVGSGRTDAGVHAEGQVANFHTTAALSPMKWVDALNAKLPPDIAVLSATEVPIGFHAQYSATSKTYRYRILNRRERSALERDRVHAIKAPLDVAAMQAASRLWIGEHDFRSFGSQMSTKERTVRTILSFEVAKRGDVVEFVVHGDGFLYNMVRSMVGTLILVGLGSRPPEWAKEVLEARDRSKAGANVPAKGLTLVEVRYDGRPRRPGPPPGAESSEEE